MSAYICSDETISVIAEAFCRYGVQYNAENYFPTDMQLILVNERVKAIGQSLLDQNYKSVNYRYSEDTETPRFEYKEIGYLSGSNNDLGLIYGCIHNYEYQACETDDFYESELYHSLQRLENEIVERALKQLGYKIVWGYDGVEY